MRGWEIMQPSRIVQFGYVALHTHARGGVLGKVKLEADLPLQGHGARRRLHSQIRLLTRGLYLIESSAGGVISNPLLGGNGDPDKSCRFLAVKKGGEVCSIVNKNLSSI